LAALFRRRSVPVPTLAGWLVVVACAAAALLLLIRAAYPFLAPNAPLGGGILVVEGWAGVPAFDAAAVRFAGGGYAHVVATGGPIEADSPCARTDATWAEHAARNLRERGIPPASLDAVAAPASAQDRTYLSAVAVREWLAARGESVDRIDVVTLGPHGRRSRRLYRQAFGDAVAIGVLSVPSIEYDPAHWWRSSEGTKRILVESIGLAWTVCCFDPGPAGSHEEMWAEPPDRR
jgi:hypothetical protein